MKEVDALIVDMKDVVCGQTYSLDESRSKLRSIRDQYQYQFCDKNDIINPHTKYETVLGLLEFEPTNRMTLCYISETINQIANARRETGLEDKIGEDGCLLKLHQLHDHILQYN